MVSQNEMLVDCKYQFWGVGGNLFRIIFNFFPQYISPSSPQIPVLTVSGTRTEFLTTSMFVWREDEDMLIPVVLRKGELGSGGSSFLGGGLGGCCVYSVQILACF